MTLNQTQARPGSQSTFAQRRRTTIAIKTPTISASAACRLGIAAYGFAANCDDARVVVHGRVPASVSVKPASGNIRGGAVGMSDVADEPDQVRDDQRVPEAEEALVRAEVDPEQRDADDRELREPVRVRGRLDEEADDARRLLERQLDIEPRLRWKSMIDRRWRTRGSTLWSAAPRATW